MKTAVRTIRTIDIKPRRGIGQWLWLFGMILLKKWMWVLGIVVLICLIPLFQWVFSSKDEPKVAALSEVGSMPAPPQAETPVVQQDPPAPPQAETQADAEAKIMELRNQISDLRTQTTETVNSVRKAAADEIAAERTKLKAEIEATFPGEARIVVEDYNPKIHVRRTLDKTLGHRTFTSEEALPEFVVSTTPRTVKAKIPGKNEPALVRDVYPVLAKDGRPLTLGTTPVLKNGKNPYQLEAEGSQGYAKMWFAYPDEVAP